MPSYRYLHLDVFTNRPFTGNQLAVFPRAINLTDRTMQAIATEMAFSETTFVLPKEDPATDVRMRIFTPAEEVPMAGHPTIGSTFALAHERQIEPGQDRFVFGLGVGPVPVALEWRDDRLIFAWMTQGQPRFGAVLEDIDGIAAALGIDADSISSTGLPLQEVSCGVPFLLVPVSTCQVVDEALPDRRALTQTFRKAGISELAVFLFSTEHADDGATAYSRMFAPSFGIVEDPATGSASGPLGCYLVKYGIVPPKDSEEMINIQGVKMGRPSRIHIAIGLDNSQITAVRVGGEAVLVGEGTIHVDAQSMYAQRSS